MAASLYNGEAGGGALAQGGALGAYPVVGLASSVRGRDVAACPCSHSPPSCCCARVPSLPPPPPGVRSGRGPPWPDLRPLRGVKPNVYGEGTHFLVPGIQRAIILDVRTQPRTIAAQTGTKDLQNVNLSLRVLSHPALPHLPEIYKLLGTDYAERVLPGICNEVLKAVVAQYDAAELFTLRDHVSRTFVTLWPCARASSTSCWMTSPSRISTSARLQQGHRGQAGGRAECRTS